MTQHRGKARDCTCSKMQVWTRGAREVIGPHHAARCPNNPGPKPPAPPPPPPADGRLSVWDVVRGTTRFNEALDRAFGWTGKTCPADANGADAHHRPNVSLWNDPPDGERICSCMAADPAVGPHHASWCARCGSRDGVPIPPPQRVRTVPKPLYRWNDDVVALVQAVPLDPTSMGVRFGEKRLSDIDAPKFLSKDDARRILDALHACDRLVVYAPPKETEPGERVARTLAACAFMRTRGPQPRDFDHAKQWGVDLVAAVDATWTNFLDDAVQVSEAIGRAT